MKQVEAALLCAVPALAWFYLADDLVQLSQGLDGTLYAGIARLMAAGQGSFWAPPHFVINPVAFHDHPPLGLWLQSRWFALLGDAFWVEKAHSVALGTLLCTLMVQLWRVLSRQHTAWWPLLLFLLMPVSTYAIKNNTLETWVALMSTAAALTAWHAQQRLWLNMLVGLLCFAAVMVKGPVALFILGVPGCFAVILHGNWRRALLASAIATATFCTLFAGMMVSDAARESWQQYYQSQVLASLAGQRSIEHGRVWQILQLGYNLLVAVTVLLMAWWFSRQINISREFRAMLIIGLSASVPLLLSPRQYQHYLLPSLPFFALAAGLLVTPAMPRVRASLLWGLSGALLLAGVARGAWHYGDYGDHQKALADVMAVGAYVARTTPQTSSIRFCDDDLRRRVYLFRHFGIRSELGRPDAGQPAAGSLLICVSGRLGSSHRLVLELNDGLRVWQRRPRLG